MSCRLIGTIRITYSEIVEKLGNPNRVNDDSESKVKWSIRVPDKNYKIYIYDWNMRRVPYGEYDWHIGGYEEDDLETIQNIFVDKIITIAY